MLRTGVIDGQNKEWRLPIINSMSVMLGFSMEIRRRSLLSEFGDQGKTIDSGGTAWSGSLGQGLPQGLTEDRPL